MKYRVNRALGYQPWGVTNPWVFANYGQPQRHRGYVSPMVFQTHPPQLKNPHLGQAVDFVEEDRRRAARMEWIAVASLGVSLFSMWFFYQKMQKPTPNRRKVRRNGSVGRLNVLLGRAERALARGSLVEAKRDLGEFEEEAFELRGLPSRGLDDAWNRFGVLADRYYALGGEHEYDTGWRDSPHPRREW